MASIKISTLLVVLGFSNFLVPSHTQSANISEVTEATFGYFNMSREFEPPTPKRRPYARYPKLAKLANLSGFVEVSFMVDPRGNTYEAVVTRSSDSIFEASALRAVRLYKYGAAQIGGTAVDGRATSILHFMTFDQDHGVRYRERKDLNELLAEIQQAGDPKDALRKKMIAGLERRSLTACGRAFTYYAMQQYAQKFGDLKLETEALQNLLAYTHFGAINLNDKRLSICFDAAMERLLFERLIRLYFDQDMSAYAYRKTLDLDADFRLEGEKVLSNISSQWTEQVASRKHTFQLSERGYELIELMSQTAKVISHDDSPIEIKLRCDAGFKELSFEKVGEIELPDDYGQCQVEIRGSAGTLVELIEEVTPLSEAIR